MHELVTDHPDDSVSAVKESDDTSSAAASRHTPS
jgi:hypothetical protein